MGQWATYLRTQSRVAFAETIRDMDRDLESAAPVDTGETRDVTNARPTQLEGPIFAAVSETTLQGYLVDRGTAPHIIEGKNSPNKVLRFEGRGGAIVFRKRVNHPGTRASRWYTRILEGFKDRYRLQAQRVFFR